MSKKPKAIENIHREDTTCRVIKGDNFSDFFGMLMASKGPRMKPGIQDEPRHTNWSKKKHF